MKCTECDKEIKNVYYLNGKAYGYNCYKKQLTIIHKQWEDANNHEYTVKCFSALQVFANKKPSTFQLSIIKQWESCKKLTANQLNAIIKNFTFEEIIAFYKVWFTLADEENKKTISSWTLQMLQKTQTWEKFLEDEQIHKIIKNGYEYRSGFHFLYDIDEPRRVFISKNGKYIREEKLFDKCYLETHLNDEYIKILKIVD